MKRFVTYLGDTVQVSAVGGDTVQVIIDDADTDIIFVLAMTPENSATLRRALFNAEWDLQ